MAIDEVFHNDGISFDDGFAHISLPRGVEAIDSDHRSIAGLRGDPSTITPVAEFATALPVGTRVLVISGPEDAASRGSGEVIAPDKGVASGATLLTGLHPQTFSVEVLSNGDTLSGWDLSYQEAVERLRSRYGD